MGAGRAGIRSRTHPRAPRFGKGNRGGVVGHTTTSEARGTTNQDYHREIRIHKHRRGSETFNFFARERPEETGSEYGLKSSRRGGESQATFVSPMSMVTKADGSWRPVTNLKCLNQHNLARHFKMESIRTAKDLLCRGDWMI